MYFLTASWTGLMYLLALLVTFLAEIFYAYPVFVLAESYWISALVVFVSVLVIFNKKFASKVKY